MCTSPTIYVCPSVCLSSTYTLFYISSTRSLDVDNTLSLSYESSYNVATSSHPIITFMNNLNLLPCKGLVNKSANILSVRQCLRLIFPCFSQLDTQKNLILMCLNLLEHEMFRSYPFLMLLHCLAKKCSMSLGIHVIPGSTHTKCCTVDNHSYLSPPICLNLSHLSSIYST